MLKALASAERVKILKLLRIRGGVNVNDIATALQLLQSTVSSYIQMLDDTGLIRTESHRAKKGNQKIYHSSFDQVLVIFKEDTESLQAETIEVAMPLGSTRVAKCRHLAACVHQRGSLTFWMCRTLFLTPTDCTQD